MFSELTRQVGPRPLVSPSLWSPRGCPRCPLAASAAYERQKTGSLHQTLHN